MKKLLVFTVLTSLLISFSISAEERSPYLYFLEPEDLLTEEEKAESKSKLPKSSDYEHPEDFEENPLPRRLFSGDDRFLIKIIEAAGKSTLESMGKGFVVDFTDEQIASLLEQESARYLSDSLALYSIGKGLYSYKHAKSEQERYFSAANVTADALVLSGYGAVPGWALKLGMLGQSIAAGYVNKQAYMKALEVHYQVELMNYQARKLILRRASAELDFMAHLYSRAETAHQIGSKIEKNLSKRCLSTDTVASLEEITLCFVSMQKIVLLRSLTARYLYEIIEHPWEIFNLSILANNQNFNEDAFIKQVNEFISDTADAQKSLSYLRNRYRNVLSLSFEFEINKAREPERKLALCLKQVEELVIPTIREATYFDFTDPIEINIISYKVSEAQGALDELCTPEVIQVARHRTGSLIKRLRAEMTSLQNCTELTLNSDQRSRTCTTAAAQER